MTQKANKKDNFDILKSFFIDAMYLWFETCKLKYLDDTRKFYV